MVEHVPVCFPMRRARGGCTSRVISMELGRQSGIALRSMCGIPLGWNAGACIAFVDQKVPELLNQANASGEACSYAADSYRDRPLEAVV